MPIHDANACTSPEQPGRSLTSILPPTASCRPTNGAPIQDICPVCIDPLGNRLHIEPHMPPDLHEWDATLVDQPADVADADAEVAGHGVDVDQRGQGCGRARM